MKTFIEFLEEVSGQTNPLRSIVPYSLDSTYDNTTYQHMLVQAFGRNRNADGTHSDECGCELSIIVDNEVLNLGQKSLFLKIAILATPQECYRFLGSIFKCIMDKKPGFYWDVLKAIKSINDHCNNTKHRCSADHYTTYKDVPCHNLFFKNSGDASQDLLTELLVKKAIQTLVKAEIERIGRRAGCTIGQNQYRDQQVMCASFLDSITADPHWLLLSASITEEQIGTSGYPNIIGAWNQRALMHECVIQGATFVHLVINGHDGSGLQPRIILNKKNEDDFDKEEKIQMKNDFLRSKAEAAAAREIESASKTPRPRAIP